MPKIPTCNYIYVHRSEEIKYAGLNKGDDVQQHVQRNNVAPDYGLTSQLCVEFVRDFAIAIHDINNLSLRLMLLPHIFNIAQKIFAMIEKIFQYQHIKPIISLHFVILQS
jgi:hypothetical protein